MFRTVVIKNASKLQYIQGYIVIFDGVEERKVYLKEVSLLIIESMRTVLTTPLLVELVNNNTTVIFCDEKSSPIGTIMGLRGHYNQSGNIIMQINWKKKLMGFVWTEIIKAKIINQIKVLEIFNRDNSELLAGYINQIEYRDITNREGLAAKVYFFSMFGKAFNRKEQTVVNELLNYGYAIILSCFNREIVKSGYLTQLGIFHHGKTNPYNLSSDLMEPFRPLIDILVYLNLNSYDPKFQIRKILTKKVIIDNHSRYLDDAISNYVSVVLRILNGDNVPFPIIQLMDIEHYKND